MLENDDENTIKDIFEIDYYQSDNNNSNENHDDDCSPKIEGLRKFTANFENKIYTADLVEYFKQIYFANFDLYSSVSNLISDNTHLRYWFAKQSCFFCRNMLFPARKISIKDCAEFL